MATFLFLVEHRRLELLASALRTQRYTNLANAPSIDYYTPAREKNQPEFVKNIPEAAREFE